MAPGKLPPRSQRSPKASAPKTPSQPVQKRRSVPDEPADSTPKKSSQPDTMGPLDYLIEYKEIALVLILVAAGYGTYAYFQPYFAAQEAAKVRPVISAQAPSADPTNAGGNLREIPASAYKPPAKVPTSPLPTVPAQPAPIAQTPPKPATPNPPIAPPQAQTTPLAPTRPLSSTPNSPGGKPTEPTPPKIRRPAF